MRHSERSCFNTCPYKYHLERKGLRRTELSDKAEDRTFGQAIHAGLKAHYDGLGWEAVCKAYSDLYPSDKEYKSKAKDYDGGIECLRNYIEYWSEQDEKWDVVGTEIEGQVKIGDEDHELHIDLLAKNKQTGEGDKVYGSGK